MSVGSHAVATPGAAPRHAAAGPPGGAGTPGHSGTPGHAGTGHRTLLTETTRAEMRQIIARYPQARSALLPMLHLVQSVEGYVTQAGIELCAQELDLTTAEVSAVATFYTMYKRRPVGEYHVGVCTNTLCAVLGGDAILHELEQHLGITHDETTEDGWVSLEHIECNAACDYAPMMTVNWEFLDSQTPASAVAAVDTLRAGGVVHSTRGPAICTWRQASRVLAGFSDGQAGAGPSAGPATLAGLRIARHNDWRAPGIEKHDHAQDRVDGAAHRATEAAVASAATSVSLTGDPVEPAAGPAPTGTQDHGVGGGVGGVGGAVVDAVEAVGAWIGEHLPGHAHDRKSSADQPDPHGTDGQTTFDGGDRA